MSALVISTLSCVLEYVAPVVIKYVVTRLHSLKKHDVELKKELLDIKQQMYGISMVDEFSRYAKLQRKYNMLEDALLNKVNERVSRMQRIQFNLISAFRLLNGILMLILLYLYKKEPVITLPKGTLWPFQHFLSWPSDHEDSISLIMWLVIARLAVSSLKIRDSV